MTTGQLVTYAGIALIAAGGALLLILFLTLSRSREHMLEEIEREYE